jgi:hypothetical protein
VPKQLLALLLLLVWMEELKSFRYVQRHNCFFSFPIFLQYLFLLYSSHPTLLHFLLFQDNCNPKWDECFLIALPSSIPPVIKISIYDSDAGTICDGSDVKIPSNIIKQNQKNYEYFQRPSDQSKKKMFKFHVDALFVFYVSTLPYIYIYQ